MKKIKLDPFWAGMAVAGAGLCALFAFWVYPKWSDREDHGRQMEELGTLLDGLSRTPLIGDVTAGVPGDNDISQWEARRDEYTKDYKTIADSHLGRDRMLEKWFGGGTAAPSADQFVSLYIDEGVKLEKALRDAGVKVGLAQPNATPPAADGSFGFNWVDTSGLKLHEKPAAEQFAIVRELQKRFWICKHIAAACLAGEAKVERICDVFFFRQIDQKRERPQGDEKIEYVDGPSSNETFRESLLPDNGERKKDDQPDPRKPLGQTISFGVTVVLPYSDTSRFLREIVSPSKTPAIVVNVIGGRFLLREQNEPSKDVEVFYKKGQEDFAKREKEELEKEEQGLRPKPVQFMLTCQAIDFDDAALPEWARK